MNCEMCGAGPMVACSTTCSSRYSDKKEDSLINHPPYYGGEENPYEAIKVIRAWGLGFCLGNTAKYIARAGKKDPSKEIEDLQKAAWYLNCEIEERKRQYEIAIDQEHS